MLQENKFEASIEVGLCRPLSPNISILPVFGVMSMLENTDSFLLLQNLLWLHDDIRVI